MNRRHFDTLAAYDGAIRHTTAAIEAGHTARATVRAQYDDLLSRATEWADTHTVKRRREFDRSLRQLDEGFGPDDGYYAEVAHLYPYPGLIRLQEQLAVLQRERAELAAELAVDPTRTRPYRVHTCNQKIFWYFGNELRRLRVGDVVHLNARLATQWANCLEPVEDSGTFSVLPAPPDAPTNEEASVAS